MGLVVGVAAYLGAQGGDVLVGDGVPVGVELGGGGVQEVKWAALTSRAGLVKIGATKARASSTGGR